MLESNLEKKTLVANQIEISWQLTLPSAVFSYWTTVRESKALSVHLGQFQKAVFNSQWYLFCSLLTSARVLKDLITHACIRPEVAAGAERDRVCVHVKGIIIIKVLFPAKICTLAHM